LSHHFQSHYLLFGQGFQTWEYAPSYALRSYAYLLVNIVPTWIYNQIFEPNKILLFYFHRCCLSLFCSFCEYYFYR
jgi:Alg9-like mannosyltransferase family.